MIHCVYLQEDLLKVVMPYLWRDVYHRELSAASNRKELSIDLETQVKSREKIW